MSYGYGSVYRVSDGGWRAAVDLPRARGEARRRKVFKGATRAAVELRLAAYRVDHPAEPRLGRAALLEAARAKGAHTEREWWTLVRSEAARCYYCGVLTTVHTARTHPTHLCQDHKTPLARGGSDHIDNIAVCCTGCNMAKGTLTEAEFATWRQVRQ